MRDFIIKSSMIIGFIILLLATSGVALALYGPFTPGNLLFPVQHFAEQQLTAVYHEPVRRSTYLLELVERRINELDSRTGTRYELISLRYLDQAIDQATIAISLIPQSERLDYRVRLLTSAQHANEVIKSLKVAPIEDKDAFLAFQSKILTVLQIMGPEQSSPKETQLKLITRVGNQRNYGNPLTPSIFVSGLIPFPPGSPGAAHNFYPLIGQHALLPCESCHNSGKYIDTPKPCILCHILKNPNPHYPGECDLCHTPVSWNDIHFEHASEAANDCSLCHESETPVNHYNEQCSACHVSQAWNIVAFDHAAAEAVDCISCHDLAAPINHYAGQCLNCHNTSNWTSVVFDHTGFTDCVSCHGGDAPSNHYSGQCINCHDTGGSWGNAHFNHSGYSDCRACHGGDAPGNHYSGQCSDCHNPNTSWRNATFDHNGLSDCLSCHAGDAPGNHYAGQCSTCHSTNSWAGAVFSHNGLTDCISCHLNDRPGEHDTGQCSECHNTQRWGD